MPNKTPGNLSPTDETAIVVYSSGTAALYARTVNAVLAPLIHQIFRHLGSSEETSKTRADFISYVIVILCALNLTYTQVNANRRALREYNSQANRDHKCSPWPVSGAIFKSIAAALSAWSSVSAISPELGETVGIPLSILTFLGSLFTQYKFLGLHPKVQLKEEQSLPLML